jgi:hypothetical protein
MRKRLITLALAAALGVLGLQGAAFADPDFGPGNSSKGPQDPGAQCHAPGQELPTPECKD